MAISTNMDLASLLEKALEDAPQERFDSVGTVVKVGDGLAQVYGLEGAVYYEYVLFDGGNKGVVFSLDENFVSVIILDRSIPVKEHESVSRTGEVFKVPVGDALLGRVISPTGKPLDGCGPIKADKLVSIERPAPGILDREPINESLETGIVAIDCLIPIGRGQRELLIGDRSTGKTAILIDTIIHQKDQDVICVYVSIGHKQSSTAKIIDTLARAGALEYTVIVEADSHESALGQFFAPYAGCSVGEYFMDAGKDVLILYDDLSAHAIAYRELSLLLRRSPGREAYPGDIFYIHSRLLERAGKLSKENGGGSLTAIPVIQTQGGDFSSYIPTNLISITDGQLFLDSNLFKKGVRPGINIGLSISRVGGQAQTPAIKKVAGRLKLDLAQSEELASFSQFGSELDKESRRVLEHGVVAKELLKQQRQETYSFVDQVIFIYLLNEHFLENFGLEMVKKFAVQCASFVREVHSDLYEEIRITKTLTDESSKKLWKIADEFSIIFPKKNTL